MISLFFWVLIFIASIILVVKSADWLIFSAEKIGLAFGISPLVIGTVIVAMGTSLPELASSTAAAIKQETEIVTSNVIGSNVANILLILGIMTIVARTLKLKDLITLDYFLLATSTVLFILVIMDGKIEFSEGCMLILAFLVYLFFSFYRRKGEIPQKIPKLKRPDWKAIKAFLSLIIKLFKVFLTFVLAIIGLSIGANFVVESISKLAQTLVVTTSLISITALAVGTSLPELVVSVRAAIRRKYDIAIGNIFGSNVFNLLFVGGFPSLFRVINVDALTLSLGLPFLILATFLLLISYFSKKLHFWEGIMYIVFYTWFIIKLTFFK